MTSYLTSNCSDVGFIVNKKEKDLILNYVSKIFDRINFAAENECSLFFRVSKNLLDIRGKYSKLVDMKKIHPLLQEIYFLNDFVDIQIEPSRNRYYLNICSEEVDSKDDLLDYLFSFHCPVAVSIPVNIKKSRLYDSQIIKRYLNSFSMIFGSAVYDDLEEYISEIFIGNSINRIEL